MSKIRLHGTSSGYVEIAPAAAAGNNTLTAPSTVGEIIAKDAAGAIGVTSVHTTNIVATGTTKVGAAVTISESGIEATGVGITCANINGGQIGGRRNIIINGAMNVAQRGTSFTGVTASGTYPVDRFLFHVGSLGTWTLTQSTDVPTGQGFAKSIKCDVTTANSSPSGTAYARIDQRFEGQDVQAFCKGTSSAKNFAVSFWVKSPKTGTHIVQLQDQDNNRTVSKAYTVSSANTWEKKELIFPADTTGAFDNDSSGSLFLAFYLAVGTGYQGGTLQTTWGTPSNTTRATGQVNVADSTDNNFYLTGVQLEVGSQATPFEHRSFGEELALCQRYCQVLGGNQSQELLMHGTFNGSGTVTGFYEAQVQFRARPSFSISNVSHVNCYGFNAVDAGSPTGMSLIGAMTDKHWIYIDNSLSSNVGTGGLTAMVRAASTTACKFTLDAEL